MIKSTKKTKATHTTRPRAAKLETPKGKPNAASAPPSHKEIRATSFILVDADGNEAAILKIVNGSAVLELGAERDVILSSEGSASFYGGSRGEFTIVDAEGVGVFNRDGKVLASVAAKKGASAPEDDEERARREAAELTENKDLEAVERLADAFATIRELWDYVPAGLRNCPLDHVNGELINSVNWENDPRAHKRVLMALLQAPERN
jgi:hypothetical protein